MKKFSPKVEMWDLDKILPYVNNNKKHPESQIAKIASSMTEFGMDCPVVVEPNGTLIKGHGRLAAARKLGLKQLPTIVRDDLTPAQIKAARIADNKVAESEFDLDALLVELEQLQELDFDLLQTGFDQDELDALFGESEPPIESSTDPVVDAGDRFLLLLEFNGEEEQQTMFAEMQERGVECKIMN